MKGSDSIGLGKPFILPSIFPWNLNTNSMAQFIVDLLCRSSEGNGEIEEQRWNPSPGLKQRGSRQNTMHSSTVSIFFTDEFENSLFSLLLICVAKLWNLLFVCACSEQIHLLLCVFYFWSSRLVYLFCFLSYLSYEDWGPTFSSL